MIETEGDVSWALKILERESDYEQNLIAKYFHEIYLGFIGAGVPAVANAVYRRPLWAGIQSHIFCAIVGIGIGSFLKHREQDILATRDAKLRDYIIRHPEDFPPPDRKKYADTFIPWVPMR